MEIKSDLYGVAERIRAIDPAYFIERNPKTEKYELHSHRDRPTLVLVFPFGELDARAVEYTLKTRAERHEALIREIEEHNRNAAREAERDAKETLAGELESALSKNCRKNR